MELDNITNQKDEKGRLICPRCLCALSKYRVKIPYTLYVCVDCLTDDELCDELEA